MFRHDLVIYIYVYVYEYSFQVVLFLWFHGFKQKNTTNPTDFPPTGVQSTSILQADGCTIGWKSSSKFTNASHLLKKYGWSTYIPAKVINGVLGGGFKKFIFSTLPGEMIHFDQYFSNGFKPPTRVITPMSVGLFHRKHFSFRAIWAMNKRPLPV